MSKDVAKLYWAGTTLWLGPWKAAELTPKWDDGDMRQAPTSWRITVGAAWRSDGEHQIQEAIERAEHVVAGQLASVGVHAVEFKRPDGTLRKVETS
jgi:hypothetical protein